MDAPQQHSKPSYKPPPPPVQQSQKTLHPVSGDESSGKKSKMSRKKRSKTQPSAPNPPEFIQQEIINKAPKGANNSNGYGSYTPYGEYHDAGNGGYISPPLTGPTSSPSPPPPMDASTLNRAVTPSLPTPPGSQTAELQLEVPSSTSKGSRWRPFGKKKSKSFSAGEKGGIPPLRPPPPGEYQLPSFPPSATGTQQPQLPLPQPQQPPQPPQPAAQSQPGPLSNNDMINPAERTNASAQQQLQDWYREHGHDPSSLEDLVHHTQYYDDDENGDVDPYYIADNKGRAQPSQVKVTEMIMLYKKTSLVQLHEQSLF